MSGIVEAVEFGARIRRLRLERRLTLKQVELASGLSATHLSEIERGRTSPTIGALVRIARALGRDASYFIESEERPEIAHSSRDGRTWARGASGVQVEALTRGVPGSRLFAYRLTLAAGEGGAFVLEPGEPGGDALYLVHGGEVAAAFGEVRTTLARGDAAHASLELAHDLRPLDGDAAEVIAILTRPLEPLP